MVAEWWALGISILALIATLTKDFFVPFIFKPRLKVEGIDDGECVENACDNMNHPSTWVRLRLSNKKSFFSKLGYAKYPHNSSSSRLSKSTGKSASNTHLPSLNS